VSVFDIFFKRGYCVITSRRGKEVSEKEKEKNLEGRISELEQKVKRLEQLVEEPQNFFDQKFESKV
jgi:hypothetical protein